MEGVYGCDVPDDALGDDPGGHEGPGPGHWLDPHDDLIFLAMQDEEERRGRGPSPAMGGGCCALAVLAGAFLFCALGGLALAH